MTTLIRIRMMINDEAKNKPNIGHKYTLVYIKGKDLAECLGNESTGEYYICENKKIIGQIKGDLDYNEKIDTKGSFAKLELSTVIKVGMFEVKRIILWGLNKSKFSIHGLPIISELCFDEDTIKIQEDINILITKYNWKLDK